ncbi:16S rRNA (uracil(1498)-N(3))-methyltransferase [Psychroserpens ponticola]|uniref:Ribosomal RNA small subunit methyltransferase E n=1 Tax=Psychroserpens ponticola TaxID=2932268 RepID=A0ABY7S1M3_9FLAO|nr:16S rRNA (uracil(1498)-N(3))-methyltransferase [Psychroserpens ponticola]WCO03299.1 16S rRNA (uracil(1498)-N(3))-methyltransferase [Psychroserpens ponticola]
MQLFFNSELSQDKDQIQFSKEESKHIIKVLRKSIGDILHITNGKGVLFTSEIIIADQKKCVSKITSSEIKPKRNYNLHLAVAPTKMNDRFEWFLEKATEIGIDSITPIFCENSERRIIKTERYEKILLSAMKQSLNCYLPILNDPINYKNFIAQKHDGLLYVAHCEESNRKSLKQELKPKQNVIILIGPEGDFSIKEIDLAIQSDYIPVTLGDTRLRTETAAIVACHSVAFVNE